MKINTIRETTRRKMKNQTPKGYNVDAALERSSKGHDMLRLKELWDSLLHLGMDPSSIF